MSNRLVEQSLRKQLEFDCGEIKAKHIVDENYEMIAQLYICLAYRTLV